DDIRLKLDCGRTLKRTNANTCFPRTESIRIHLPSRPDILRLFVQGNWGPISAERSKRLLHQISCLTAYVVNLGLNPATSDHLALLLPIGLCVPRQCGEARAIWSTCTSANVNELLDFRAHHLVVVLPIYRANHRLLPTIPFSTTPHAYRSTPLGPHLSRNSP